MAESACRKSRERGARRRSSAAAHPGLVFRGMAHRWTGSWRTQWRMLENWGCHPRNLPHLAVEPSRLPPPPPMLTSWHLRGRSTSSLLSFLPETGKTLVEPSGRMAMLSGEKAPPHPPFSFPGRYTSWASLHVIQPPVRFFGSRHKYWYRSDSCTKLRQLVRK